MWIHLVECLAKAQKRTFCQTQEGISLSLGFSQMAMIELSVQ